MSEFRKTPPEPLDPAPFDLAKPFETTLANGLKVVIIENDRVPLVNFRLAFKNGAVNDPADMPALSEAAAKMLNEGTKTRTSRQIAEEVDRIGGALSTSVSADNTIIAASAVTMYASEILGLMADIVLNPLFPEKELNIFRENAREELKLHRSQADFLVSERAAKILFGDHPYSVVSNTNAMLDNLSAEKLAEFHRAVFIPNNAVFIAVGDVKSEALVAELNSLFGEWAQGEVKSAEFPAFPERSQRTLAIVNRPNSSQANIILGNIAIKRTDPDFFPLTVMNMVLGGGASSRLFMNLREEKGYTYGAYSSLEARRLAGLFESAAEVRTAVTGDSLKEFFYELERIRTTPVPDEELNDAKNYLTGSFPLRMETQEGLTNQIVSQQLFHLPDDYLQTFRDNINAVTAADVQRVAQKHIHLDTLAIIIVGDAAQLLDQVAPYAKNIDVYDAEGNIKDVKDIIADPDAPPANVNGIWGIKLDVLPLGDPEGGMTLRQDEHGQVTGDVSIDYFGDGTATGSVTGNSLTMTMPTQIMAAPYTLTFIVTVDGNSMSGVMKCEGFMEVPDSPLTGTRG